MKLNGADGWPSQVDVEDPVSEERGPPSPSYTPRLGRRESEPHSLAIHYLVDVLRTNFPNDRAFPDLLHVFDGGGGETVKLQPDVSFFVGFRLEQLLPSYKATEHGNRVPAVVFNVLSKGTWRNDVSVVVEKCIRVGVPVYVLFASHDVGEPDYRPPFLRAYFFTERGWRAVDVRRAACSEGATGVDESALVDLRPHAPFRVGLKRVGAFHGGGASYLLVLVKPDSPEPFPTKAEEAERKAEEAERKARAYYEKLKELGFDPSEINP